MPQSFESVQVLVWVEVAPQAMVSGNGCQSEQDQLGVQTGSVDVASVVVASVVVASVVVEQSGSAVSISPLQLLSIPSPQISAAPGLIAGSSSLQSSLLAT